MVIVYFITGLFLILSPALVTMESSCYRNTNCEECILDSSGCAWCAQINLNTTRCRLRRESLSWCAGHLIDPPSLQNITENLDYNANAGKIIQLKPQKATLSMRVGDSINFDFGFLGVSGYPIDLYFLLDVSTSMNNIIKTTINQTKDIYETMSSFTKDVRLGFGTFVDKNSFPFTYNINSTLTYSFKHQLKFTANYKTFRDRIYSTPLGLNSDAPEGGFDALSQVIACKHEIGWRKESRKIIIFLTDAVYHSAGDGKWAGIVKPYDGKCYMNRDGTYSKELELDYPSVSIVSKMAREEEITIIFVTKYFEASYKKLDNTIRGFRAAQYNTEMAQLLKKVYEDISRKFQLKTTISPALRNHVSIDFNPKCHEAYCNYTNSHEINFKGKVILKSLPDSNIQNLNLNVSIEGIDEKLMLNIDIISKCNCVVEYNSSECYTEGNLRCGICECNGNRYGNNCQCKINSKSNVNDNSSCISHGTNEVCSGRGRCTCGMCQCTKSYSGKNCECDNESCHRDIQGKLCSGHGSCVCGICKCDAGWSGQMCDCPRSKDKCYTSDPEKLCSSLGKCTCNTCQCDPPHDWDARVRQDNFCGMLPCSLCHSAQCQKLDACANCHYHQRNSKNRQDLCKDKCYGLTNISTQFTENITDTISNASDTWNICTDIKVSTGCYIIFTYKYNEEDYGVNILIETVENCAQSYYFLGATCLATIIIIGVLTAVVWKIRCEYQDRKEYSNFIKNLAINTRDFVNPLHIRPETTYSNPTYGQY